MVETRDMLEAVEQLVNRVSRATEQLVSSSAKQLGNLEQRMRELADRLETAADRLGKRLDQELREQIAWLTRELDERVGARLSVRGAPAKKTTAKTTAAAKKTLPGRPNLIRTSPA